MGKDRVPYQRCRMLLRRYHAGVPALAGRDWGYFAAMVSLILLAGCAAPGKPAAVPATQAARDSVSRLLQDIDPPRRIGVVENCGLQIPAISPDGRQLLYLRVDQARAPAASLLGAETPPTGTLSIWIRPVQGAALGNRLSAQRWAHSPVWSDSGQAVAYVANEPAGSVIMHVDLATGLQRRLGLPDAMNCLPRFDADDQTLLFCAAPSVDGPFRIYRQVVGESQPTAVSPEGADFVLPVKLGAADRVLCARAEGDRLNWVWAGRDATTAVAPAWGQSSRMEWLQIWAGIAAPVSPDRDAVLFYDCACDRVCVLHLAERTLRQHRPGSIAGCWLDRRTIALATQAGVFITDTQTGQSAQLLSGPWIPCRYVPGERRLILLGQQTSQYFAIWEVAARQQGSPDQAAGHPGGRPG